MEQIDTDKLVKVYIKIRDAKKAITEKYESDVAELDKQMDAIEGALLELCKTTGQEGGTTKFGRFTRKIATRYITNNWPALHELVVEHNVPQLLEQRISQTNMKTFLSENPALMPAGLQVDQRYRVTVTRPSQAKE